MSDDGYLLSERSERRCTEVGGDFDAALRLCSWMRRLSREIYSASWLNGIEFMIWDAMISGYETGIAKDMNYPEDTEAIKSLHNKCHGWWHLGRLDSWPRVRVNGDVGRDFSQAHGRKTTMKISRQTILNMVRDIAEDITTGSRASRIVHELDLELQRYEDLEYFDEPHVTKAELIKAFSGK